MTGREITYSIINILTRLGYTDDSRIDPDFINFLRDNARAQLIIAAFRGTKVVNPAWMQDLGFVQLTKVDFNDDTTIPYCECELSKIILPGAINLFDPMSQDDLSTKIYSSCGTKEFYPYPINLLAQIPKEHVRSKSNYYSATGNAYYINKIMDKVRVNRVLASPKDANIINSEYVLSGNLTVGTSYTVYDAQVTHNSLGYNVGQSFTAVNANYGGLGKVKLSTIVSAYTEDSVYPVTPDMARAIILEVLTKEFKIEESQISDVKNDSTDDQQDRRKIASP